MRLKKIVRKIVGAKENENIVDAANKKLLKIFRLFFRKKITDDMLKSAVLECGIARGDMLMVHCSWRAMFNYLGTPEDVIQILLEILGDTGTLVMPCYGANLRYFDLQNTPSNAGVLSEVFRKMPGIKRSACTHFSIAAVGADAEKLIAEHSKSYYGFDKYSPLYKLGMEENAKILFLGLGSKPTKISIFHCAAEYLKNCDEKLKKLLDNEYESQFVDLGIVKKKIMYTRRPGHSNNKRMFIRIFNSLKSRKRKKVSNVDVVVINAKEAFEKAVQNALEGKYCYKNMKRL